jgi:hypothetical protein
MADALTRRRFLHGAASGAALLSVAPAYAARGKLAAFGSGQVREPIPGVTVPSPSDFSFAADEEGGFFLCSMFGPETGGFLGCDLMTVQGVVSPGTIQIKRGVVTFSGKLDIFLFPNIFTQPPGPYLNAAANDFTAIARFGGPGKGSLVLKIPVATANVGGDTGGILQYGRIGRARIR